MLPVRSYRHDITEILLTVVLNTITPNPRVVFHCNKKVIISS